MGKVRIYKGLRVRMCDLSGYADYVYAIKLHMKNQIFQSTPLNHQYLAKTPLK